jgi:hypothetical protein
MHIRPMAAAVMEQFLLHGQIFFNTCKAGLRPLDYLSLFRFLISSMIFLAANAVGIFYRENKMAVIMMLANMSAVFIVNYSG